MALFVKKKSVLFTSEPSFDRVTLKMVILALFNALRLPSRIVIIWMRSWIDELFLRPNFSHDSSSMLRLFLSR